MSTRTLEILTTQNVTIEYPLAGLQERFIAFFLDFLFIFLISVLFYLFSLFILPREYANISVYFTAIPVVVFYSLISEIAGNGQSWGKKITGLKIVKISGSEVRLSDTIARWMFRVVDIYLSLGGIGMFLITSTPRSQRLGDIVANTTVINIKPGNSPRLQQIEKIRSLEDYTPVYRQVIQMNESQMLLIKSALEEIKEYPNRAHKEALSEMTEIICQRLNIQKGEERDDKFLQQLINDYIVLTR